MSTIETRCSDCGATKTKSFGRSTPKKSERKPSTCKTCGERTENLFTVHRPGFVGELSYSAALYQ